MGYDPYKPRLIKRGNQDGTYKVLIEQKGKSGQILRDKLTKTEADEFMRKVKT